MDLAEAREGGGRHEAELDPQGPKSREKCGPGEADSRPSQGPSLTSSLSLLFILHPQGASVASLEYKCPESREEVSSRALHTV